MANFIRAKITSAVFSIAVIVVIPLLESNFNTTVVIKRWSSLSWNDFNGVAPPFGHYDARISSEIYLEFDSARSRFHAYAGQNNVRSWVRTPDRANTALLNHEQYHFNITEVHARLLNDYINENPNESEYRYRLRLQSLNVDLDRMQRQYDVETRHSIARDQQHLWEYTIDSLLSRQTGWVQDASSGLVVYFPTTPKIRFDSAYSNTPYYEFELIDYGMYFQATAFKADPLGKNQMRELLEESTRQRSQAIISVDIDSTAFDTKASIVLRDSTHNISVVWQTKNGYFYVVSAGYPFQTDSIGYEKMAKSFISGFDLETDK